MSHARQTSILNLRPALWRFGPNTSFNPTAKKLRFFGSLAALGGGLIPALGPTVFWLDPGSGMKYRHTGGESWQDPRLQFL